MAKEQFTEDMEGMPRLVVITNEGEEETIMLDPDVYEKEWNVTALVEKYISREKVLEDGYNFLWRAREAVHGFKLLRHGRELMGKPFNKAVVAAEQEMAEEAAELISKFGPVLGKIERCTRTNSISDRRLCCADLVAEHSEEVDKVEERLRELNAIIDAALLVSDEEFEAQHAAAAAAAAQEGEEEPAAAEGSAKGSAQEGHTHDEL
mmetsp:Transcript_17422/g.67655  ORF Transcript_17422/g.67655 Transcript_17422/m.67655 type:complete len:207 (+) Transcript_17422:180-800(+)|eukprot:CAMPEP_0114615918 /NCGR_PEP_ID=MMETSP0168-20121206/6418_1 /TAXON_ID=95228 ORGANISM="Vannella sp., Strain DIVA3 517/6/12" /NCGR_SAMPLE_ID=MMETSP0168 /ASSEMBLY_ACC=CAM_ASM_000044 /LENGTH=206 /DNA_ID=CAMNT_0001827015 /DNA_START=171 /DNA_END=791 /DNA_ORIENTATION=-